MSLRHVTALVVVIAALVVASPASGHFYAGHHNVIHAINQAWCGKANVQCRTAREAYNVSRCETGGTFSVWAGYGKHQYLGLFQMGQYARSTFGHGTNPWAQARAAFRYWKVAGWSPWQCTPWGSLRW